jgi:hypothetical protein
MGDWTMMTGYGPAHWVIFAIIIAAILYPLGRILTSQLFYSSRNWRNFLTAIVGFAQKSFYSSGNH